MSRIGILPIEVPNGVTVDIDEKTYTVTVKGPKGELTEKFRPEVSILQNDNLIRVERKNETKKARGFHGLYRKLVSNMVHGVSQGFRISLLINGVGYRAEMDKDVLVLNLGFSNPIEFPVPDGLTITCEGTNKVIVEGADKQKVGQTAAEIRSLRPPEPYKGKGVKYEEELISRKIGKTGVK